MTATLLICTPSHHLHGGVERIIEALGAGLPGHGLAPPLRVVVGLARGGRFHLPERYRREYPSLECVEIDGRSGTRLGRVRAVRRVLDQVRPDVVLIARLFDAYQAVVEHKARGSPVRLAVTVQAYEADYLTDLEAYADWVDLCVTSGNLIAIAVERFTSVPPRRVLSIPGGVRPAARPIEFDDERPLRLGYVGRLAQEQKRVFDLADTLAALAAGGVPFTCRVAGTGPDEAALRRRLNEKGLGARVTFHGWMSLDQLYQEIYPDLDVLLHFAAWEGVTIAPREAMAHGAVPVVARFTGLRAEGQFVHQENALTFPVGDVSRAVAAVTRLHEDRGLLRRLSFAARQSQHGVRSESGALAAWAEAISYALQLPGRRGSQVPRLPWPPNGRLERWGLSPQWSERLRRWTRRQCLHNEPGAEWPHRSGLADPARLRAIADFAEAYEKEIGRERLSAVET
jgi:glycosyltransferase involved in cell wall biosynthesis